MLESQTYLAKIRFQLRNDVIHFIVKSDGSGDLDYIKILDGYLQELLDYNLKALTKKE